MEITKISKDVGFSKIKLFGNLKLDEYKSQKSENIVAFLHK